MRTLTPIFVGLTLLGCTGGKIGGVIEPPKPTAAEVMGELVCQPGQDRAEPLIVDWSTDDRVDLEIAMRDGLVVVAYDCDSFRVLDHCHARGGYQFAGVSRKEDTRQFTSAGELHANFPVGAARLAATLEREASLDLAMVTIGKHRTSAWKLARTELEGDCADATHFMTSAIVGAFAMRTGTRGFIQTVAEVFGALESGGSSTSATQTAVRDGVLEACLEAAPLDPAPPAQCQSMLRVELVGLADEPVEPPGPAGELAPLGPSCPAGFVDVGGVCAEEAEAQAEAKPHRCAPGDVADCTAQCDAGDADSCFNLAVAYVEGEGVERDRDAARARFDQACTGGNTAACTQLALRLKWKDEGERVASLLDRSCAEGDALACRTFGQALIRGRQLAADPARGERLLARSCELADPHGCPFWAAHLVNVTNDPKQAREVVAADCERGNGQACAFLGAWLSRCSAGTPPGMSNLETCQRFPDVDEAAATQAYERACRAGVLGVCNTAADRLADAPARAEQLRAFAPEATEAPE